MQTRAPFGATISLLFPSRAKWRTRICLEPRENSRAIARAYEEGSPVGFDREICKRENQTTRGGSTFSLSRSPACSLSLRVCVCLMMLIFNRNTVAHFFRMISIPFLFPVCLASAVPFTRQSSRWRRLSSIKRSERALYQILKKMRKKT